ncbi:MAG: archease [Deltaproteobacteria bacterium RIFOXYD12_FULL_57_12]|nr:MAG: archease [Deltaproteobacteria bacterium RIFOXYD12_FULL_57_12]
MKKARGVRKRGESGWEHFHHVADIGVRGFGQTREQAFEQTALALIAVITKPQLVRPETLVEVSCEEPDDEFLLTAWLNALIYEMAQRRMLFSRFQVTIVEHALQGRAWGEQVDVQRHKPAVEVKGATLTALSVGQQADGRWVAQCVVDV